MTTLTADQQLAAAHPGTTPWMWKLGESLTSQQCPSCLKAVAYISQSVGRSIFARCPLCGLRFQCATDIQRYG